MQLEGSKDNSPFNRAVSCYIPSNNMHYFVNLLFGLKDIDLYDEINVL